MANGKRRNRTATGPTGLKCTVTAETSNNPDFVVTGRRAGMSHGMSSALLSSIETEPDPVAVRVPTQSTRIFLARATLAHTLDSDTERMLGITMSGSRCVRAADVESIELIAPMVALIQPKKGPRVWVQIAMGVEA